MSAPTADPHQLATAMKSGLSNSGLFYESHLAEWHQGQRDLNDIQQEPQASLDHTLPEDASTLNAIVRAQLDALDTGQIHWQGQLWPGQTMDWRLQQQAEPQHQTHQETCSERAWRSTLKLSLPTLGDITAKLILHEGQLRLSLSASVPATARVLAQNRSQLATGCAQAGIPLEHCNIE